LGYLSLEFRGLAERLYWATCAKIRDYCRKLDRVPEELDNIEDMLSDIYFCNFSIFQSLPDSWAIGQVFPIMPIQRLGERPTRNAVLADITCDSDGKIDKFVHPCRTGAAGGSRKSSRAIRPIRFSSTWSTTPTSCIPGLPGIANGLYKKGGCP
jgi:hypothetical protein